MTHMHLGEGVPGALLGKTWSGYARYVLMGKGAGEWGTRRIMAAVKSQGQTVSEFIRGILSAAMEAWCSPRL